MPIDPQIRGGVPATTKLRWVKLVENGLGNMLANEADKGLARLRRGKNATGRVGLQGAWRASSEQERMPHP